LCNRLTGQIFYKVKLNSVIPGAGDLTGTIASATMIATLSSNAVLFNFALNTKVSGSE
jgi:hypothetical protein